MFHVSDSSLIKKVQLFRLRLETCLTDDSKVWRHPKILHLYLSPLSYLHSRLYLFLSTFEIAYQPVGSHLICFSVSEASFCGGKENGNYQAPTTCQAYIACSYGVTSHVQCPFGKKFDTLKRICVLVDQAACTVVLPSKKSKPFMIVTL